MSVLLWLLLAAFITSPASAHEIRPAYLEIREVSADTYDLLWKTPAQGDMRLALNVILPAECRNVSEPRMTPVDGAAIQRWRTVCAGGLVGRTIGVENLGATLTDAIVRFQPLSGASRMLRLNGERPSGMIPARQAFGEVAGSFFVLGVEHIAFGFDHLLFVLCLLMLVRDLKRLLGAITAFTVAHSITLAGTTFGWLHLSAAPVEALIALSIAFVAAEILRARAGAPSTMQRWPWIASFGFGLLHGFGFAAALREVGLPEEDTPAALLFFNLGVEAGQVAVVAIVLSGLALWRRLAPPAPAWTARAAPYFAGTVGAFWFVERTSAILWP